MNEIRTEIVVGDAGQKMQSLRTECVQSIVTSPPYFKQRDYEANGQVGNEDSLERYIERLVEIFRESKRVLRRDGTLWLNIGDKIIKKQMQGIPWKVAFALQSDGWILRQWYPWVKRNALPCPSMTECAHLSLETVFQFSKNEECYYDAESAKECLEISRNWRNGDFLILDVPTRKNFKAHFATFPVELATVLIRAGTSDRGACSVCYSPWRRLLKKTRIRTRPGTSAKIDNTGRANRDPGRHITEVETLGWEPSCQCQSTMTKPCIVLDPFGGLATTAVAARRLGRDSIMIELNKEYAKLASERLSESEGCSPILS